MATRTCPDCGAQYVATVRRCIDCDITLADEILTAGAPADDDAVSSGAPVGAGDQIGYELDGWGNQLKVTLEGMLDRAAIGRVWEAGALVISVADEEAVDELIATLEGEVKKCIWVVFYGQFRVTHGSIVNFNGGALDSIYDLIRAFTDFSQGGVKKVTWSTTQFHFEENLFFAKI